MRNYLINSMIIKARGKISEQTNNFNLTFVLNIKHIDDSNHFNLSIQSLKIFHEYKFFDKKNWEKSSRIALFRFNTKEFTE